VTTGPLALTATALALTGAQISFAVALGVIALVITCFALYVASSTVWSDRWYRRRRSR
jgi:hypothetical protein